MNAQPDDLEEFCPRCGHWHAKLNWYTGWCLTCSSSHSASVKRAYRAAHRDTEKARDKARRVQLGTGTCPHCGRGGLPMCASGGVGAHPYKRQVGGPRCPGSGKAPT